MSLCTCTHQSTWTPREIKEPYHLKNHTPVHGARTSPHGGGGVCVGGRGGEGFYVQHESHVANGKVREKVFHRCDLVASLPITTTSNKDI